MLKSPNTTPSFIFLREKLNGTRFKMRIKEPAVWMLCCQGSHATQRVLQALSECWQGSAGLEKVGAWPVACTEESSSLCYSLCCIGAQLRLGTGSIMLVCSPAPKCCSVIQHETSQGQNIPPNCFSTGQSGGMFCFLCDWLTHVLPHPVGGVGEKSKHTVIAEVSFESVACTEVLSAENRLWAATLFRLFLTYFSPQAATFTVGKNYEHPYAHGISVTPGKKDDESFVYSMTSSWFTLIWLQLDWLIFYLTNY